MNTEERIRQHLEATTASLQAPDRLEEVMTEGRRRKIRSRTASVLAAAAVVAGVVTVAGALMPPSTPGGVLDSVPTSTPTTGPTSVASTIPPADVPALGVVVADPDGVRVIDRDGDTEAELVSADPYGEIAAAYPDGSGGLVYQHATTPLPWEQGTVLHLPAGTARPVPLVAPAAGGNLVSVGTGHTERGWLFYYIEEDFDGGAAEATVRAVGFDDGETYDVTALRPGVDVSAGGSVVALVDRSDMGCVRVSFVDVFAGELDSPLADDCHPIDTGVAMGGDGADGNTVGFLAGGVLELRSLETGEILGANEIPDAYMVTYGSGGWAVRTPEETVLITTELINLPAVEAGSVVPYNVPFQLHPDATLSPAPETTDLLCAPEPGQLAEQDLPPEVADTRARLFAAAAACDYDALAEMARTDGTTLTFGASGDPVEQWVGEGRSEGEPLAILAGLLNTRPDFDDQAGLWAWPAAHIDPADQSSWEELRAVLGQETVDLLREYPDGYLGHRVGIAADGTWLFFVGGD